MKLWTASVNQPGCLPDAQDQPAVFTDPSDAWASLYDGRVLAFMDMEADPADDTALEHMFTMLNTPDHNQYGTVQGVDPANPAVVLNYSVEPIDVRTFLSNHTVASAVDAFQAEYNEYNEEYTFTSVSADDLHSLLVAKATEREVYRAATDAYVNRDLGKTGATLNDVLLSEILDFVLPEPEYLVDRAMFIDTLIDALLLNQF